MKKNTSIILLKSLFLFVVSFQSFGQVYFTMSSGNYSETFSSWSSPSTNSWSSVAANTGTIPSANATTISSTSFSSGSAGGIHNGVTNIQFLSTGTSDNSSAVALDLNLNFSEKNAGSLTFDAATVFNQTGNRAGTLRVYYSVNGSTWTEITGTDLPFSANNNVAKTSTINITLPAIINNEPTVKLRFYYHNGGSASSPTGSRPKISIDNVSVTAVSSGPTISIGSSTISNLNYFTGNGPSQAQSYRLNGSLLTGDVSVTASPNFEISSTSNTTGFSNILNITPESGSIDRPIYVRLMAGLSANTYSGSISHTGGSAPTAPILNLSGTVSDIVLPTKLSIISTVPFSPFINSPFSITIQSTDNNNVTQNVASNTNVSISLNTGTGSLGGTLTGTIPAGSNSLTLSGLTYNKEETGVSLTATSTSGDILANGFSSIFEVIQNVFPNEIKSIRDGNWNNPTTWSCNCIPTFTDNVRVRIPHRITVTPLPTEQGCANILIENGAVFDLQTGVFRMNMTPPPVQSSNINITLGNPSNATTNINTPDNYLLEKPQYVMSYNRSKATSNWVSWYLNSSSIGSTSRQNDFRPDPQLPSGWYQVSDTDYSGSGFDRGHMTPSGDRTSSVANNSATFLMTNMIPQAPGNNQGPWEKLESYLRGQLNANGGQEIYIISGSYGVGGVGTNGSASSIANGQITVPEQTYKIAVILSNGDNDISRITNNTRVIAVIMPNIESIRPNQWQPYRTTVNAIEAATGYDFLSNVPVSIQDILEARTDTVSN